MAGEPGKTNSLILIDDEKLSIKKVKNKEQCLPILQRDPSESDKERNHIEGDWGGAHSRWRRRQDLNGKWTARGGILKKIPGIDVSGDEEHDSGETTRERYQHQNTVKSAYGDVEAKGDVKVTDLDNRFFLMRLALEKDYSTALLNGPWSYRKIVYQLLASLHCWVRHLYSYRTMKMATY